jgi:hypothetical protein
MKLVGFDHPSRAAVSITGSPSTRRTSACCTRRRQGLAVPVPEHPFTGEREQRLPQQGGHREDGRLAGQGAAQLGRYLEHPDLGVAVGAVVVLEVRRCPGGPIGRGHPRAPLGGGGQDARRRIEQEPELVTVRLPPDRGPWTPGPTGSPTPSPYPSCLSTLPSRTSTVHHPIPRKGAARLS